MDIMDVIEKRHSVRSYTEQKIEQEKRDVLIELINKFNEEDGINIQILFEEPKCFDNFKAHYGKFKNVNNYIALVGTKSDKLDEKLGYYGEEIVLKAQEIGLNTCWVAGTHGKSASKVEKNEKEVCIISIGYGETQGVERKSKSITDVSNHNELSPEWFTRGVKAALLAPTAINQQKFYITAKVGEVRIEVKGLGILTKLDLGIVKCHFELASGHKVI